MNASGAPLPDDVVVLERGWLSSNNVVLVGPQAATVVDTGYWTHAPQTIELVRRACAGKPLATIVNTHLHSDHCGGNAALQEGSPGVRTLIPPGLASAVAAWDEVALTYEPTGQVCPQFSFDGLLEPGKTVRLGARDWQVQGAPGHDPHSVVLFEPETRILISADALWENGFGIVFPELEGDHAFDDVAATLDLIERLCPAVVVPGHGRVFRDVSGALTRARSRLSAYMANPVRHATHAAKVLLKFRLLEWQAVELAVLLDWALRTPYLAMIHGRCGNDRTLREWILSLVDDLTRSGALRAKGALLLNA